jgi:opacity protein-like surface antigen
MRQANCRVIQARMARAAGSSLQTPRGRSRGLTAAVGSALLLLTGAAQAAWEVQPGLQVQTRWEDNIRMRPADEETGYVNSVTAQARVSRVNETSQIAALASAGLTRYAGVDSLSSTDSRETLLFVLSGTRNYQRGQLGLNASYRRQDVLQGLLLLDDGLGFDPGDETIPEPGIEDVLAVLDPVVGSVQDLLQQNFVEIAPSAQFQLSDRTAIGFGYRFNDQSYDEPGNTISNTQDSRSHTVSMQLRRALSERDVGWLQVAGSRFEPEFSADADTVSITLNWSRDLDERTRMTLGIGGRQTDRAGDETSGVIFDGRLDRRLARGTASLAVERSTQPNGYGNLVETDRLTARYSYGFSERWNAGLQVNVNRINDEGSQFSNRSQELFQISPRVSWRLAENWTVNANYAYTRSDRKRQDGEATRNAVAVGIAYQPPRRL